jgi:cyclic pyranopterin phosphate synthase
MLDRLQRPVRDLRISVTDRCNFRCAYCMPADVFGPGHAFLPRAELLSFEEITRLARVFGDHGVTKLRLTGGEPLLRRELPRLVEMLAGVEGIDDLAMTTNGSWLAARAGELADAGLSRVTVSLDALDDATLAGVSGSKFTSERILAGIDAAAAEGLTPLKVNMVVRRGVNDHAVLEMAEYFRGRGHTLRFIEFMDVGTTNRWRMDEVVPSAEIRDLIAARWPLEPVVARYPGEVAERYRYADGAGEIGLISSVTQPFCGACSRARLSADGRLYTCLFAETGTDLRALLRGGAADEAVSERVGAVWGARQDRYSEMRTQNSAGAKREKIEMSYIGG